MHILLLNDLNSLDFHQQSKLPNATTSLVLVIVSIVSSCLGIGIICGVMGLLLADKDQKLYWSTPETYSSSSYNTSNIARTCAIIGIIIGGIILMLFIILVIWNFTDEVNRKI